MGIVQVRRGMKMENRGGGGECVERGEGEVGVTEKGGGGDGVEEGPITVAQTERH